jgi:hypothetical protein
MADSPLKDEIESAATQPAQAQSDGVVVKARSIDEMIKADKYLAGQNAKAASASNGMIFQNIRPGGATGG